MLDNTTAPNVGVTQTVQIFDQNDKLVEVGKAVNRTDEEVEALGEATIIKTKEKQIIGIIIVIKIMNIYAAV